MNHQEVLTLESISDSSAYSAIAGIQIDKEKFKEQFGETALNNWINKFEECGFWFRGVCNDGYCLLSFPTPLLDHIREEIECIIQEEIFKEGSQE